MSTIEIYTDEIVQEYQEKIRHTNNIQTYQKYMNELKEYLQKKNNKVIK